MSSPGTNFSKKGSQSKKAQSTGSKQKTEKLLAFGESSGDGQSSPGRSFPKGRKAS